jgi:hypothetical protein
MVINLTGLKIVLAALWIIQTLLMKNKKQG